MRVERLDGGPHALGEHPRRVEIDAGQHEQKFLAAPPDQDVVGADRSPQQVADVAQQLIARLVPERVVHLLEAIDVDQDAAERPPFALGARDLVRDVFLAAAAIGQAGQRIGCGEMLQRLHFVGVHRGVRAARFFGRPGVGRRAEHAIDFVADFAAERRKRVDVGGGQRDRFRVEHAQRGANVFARRGDRHGRKSADRAGPLRMNCANTGWLSTFGMTSGSAASATWRRNPKSVVSPIATAGPGSRAATWNVTFSWSPTLR